MINKNFANSMRIHERFLEIKMVKNYSTIQTFIVLFLNANLNPGQFELITLRLDAENFQIPKVYLGELLSEVNIVTDIYCLNKFLSNSRLPSQLAVGPDVGDRPLAYAARSRRMKIGDSFARAGHGFTQCQWALSQQLSWFCAASFGLRQLRRLFFKSHEVRIEQCQPWAGAVRSVNFNGVLRCPPKFA